MAIDKSVKHNFLYILVWELILGGSGQVIHLYGDLTLRMFLFILALIIGFWAFIKYPLPKYSAKIIYYYFVTFCLGIFIACLSSTSNKLLFDDIKPLLYFFISFYFCWAIDDIKVVYKLIDIIKWASLVLAVIYLFYLAMIQIFGIWSFSSMYSSLSNESDIMFRGEEGFLFYKGFVYLPLGLLFFVREKKYWQSAIILVATYLTFTRGFYIMTFCAIILNLILQKHFNFSRLCLLIIVVLIIFFGCYYFQLFDMGDNRAEGDALRFVTMEQVYDRVTVWSILWGHGFGNGVPVRTVHMENSYLEIFHKQGVIGLSFWIYVLYMIIAYYKKITVNKQLAQPFLIGAFIIYVQSLFNPYINNSIGMGFIIMSYLSVYYLEKKKTI